MWGNRRRDRHEDGDRRGGDAGGGEPLGADWPASRAGDARADSLGWRSDHCARPEDRPSRPEPPEG
ncbi:MAG: hypothetical protein ACYDEN_05880 [Acidimicrobiales bacterium]